MYTLIQGVTFPNELFQGFFGDFCLIFFGIFLLPQSRVIGKESKKTDEKGRVRAGIQSLLIALSYLKLLYYVNLLQLVQNRIMLVSSLALASEDVAVRFCPPYLNCYANPFTFKAMASYFTMGPNSLIFTHFHPIFSRESFKCSEKHFTN